MAYCILDKAYKVMGANGVPAYRVVVQGPNAGECKLPTAANDGAILGVTMRSQSLQGQHVTVRKAGTVLVETVGRIELGTPVNIADGADGLGKVKAINEATGTKINCVGFAETAALALSKCETIEVFLSLHERTAP